MTHWWQDADPPAAPARVPASRELFEDWLAEMDHALEGFAALGLPDQVTARPHSRDALEQLEAVVLSRYPDREALVAARGPWVDGAVRYVGETFRRAFGGRWEYSTDPGDAVVGRPYVRLDTAPGVAFSPFHALAMAVTDRSGDVLARTWDAQARDLAEGASPPVDAVAGDSRGPDEPTEALGGFVRGLDDAVDAWAQGPAAPPHRWDGSAGSIDELAREVAARGLPAGDPMDDPFLRGAARYLGRTLQLLAGGDWERGLGRPDPMSPYAGRFYLVRIDEDGGRISVSPEFLVEVAAEEADASVLVDGARAYLP